MHEITNLASMYSRIFIACGDLHVSLGAVVAFSSADSEIEVVQGTYRGIDRNDVPGVTLNIAYQVCARSLQT